MTILFPVQAYIVRQFTAQALMVTLIPGLYAAVQFFGAPILGKLSDRYGRRPILLISLFGSAVGYFLFGIGQALWILFLSRVIDGFSGGNNSTASAYIADVTEPKDRARSFGLVGAMFGLGFIIGPMLGGALSQISLRTPAFVSCAFALLSVLVGFFLLPESLPADKRQTKPLTLADLNPFGAMAELLRRPQTGAFLITQCLFTIAFSGINSIFGVFMIERFNVQPLSLSLLIAAGGITTGVVQAGLVGMLVKRFGEKPLAAIALLLHAVGALGFSTVPAFWLIYPICLISFGSSGLFFPTIGALLSNSVTLDEQGKVNGVSAALGSLASILGPLWAGLAYDQIQVGMPYWTAAILLIAGAMLLLRSSRRLTAPQTHLH
jgi:MFS transporter, DHA1 family, tetracycline resistance protein